MTHKEPKKRFEVKKVFWTSYCDWILKSSTTDLLQKFNAVALWAWDIVVDNCAICRNHIMDLCMLLWLFKMLFVGYLAEKRMSKGIECQANQASATSEECTVAWGICNVSCLFFYVKYSVRLLSQHRHQSTHSISTVFRGGSKQGRSVR
jgi:hypothetical protein